MKNLEKRISEIIDAAGLPETPETRQMVEDVLLNRTDRYTEEELDKIDLELAKRIMNRAEAAEKGVRVGVYFVSDMEENVMYG
jgi:hypothetical protein